MVIRIRLQSMARLNPLLYSRQSSASVSASAKALVQDFPEVDTILVLGSLLTLGAVICLVLGMWRVGTDLELASSFFISDGFLSHWQVWFALSIVLEVGSFQLTRLSRRNARVEALSTLTEESEKEDESKTAATV